MALPAQAQDVEAVRFATLEIALWPEFDEPELLVIFQGHLADEVPLPASLTLTMPKEAGEPHAVASVDAEGRRLTAAYEAQVVGQAMEVTYTSLQDREFQFEYYWDVLQVDGDRREFTFRYQLDAAVDDLTLVLQQPTEASNVVLVPPAVEASPGFGGLTHHWLPLGAVDAGQTVEWQVSYDKSGFLLSNETLSAGETEPAPSASSPVFGVVAVVGLALAAALAGLWFVGSRRQAQGRQRRPKPQGAIPPRPRKRKDRKGTQPQPRATLPAKGRSSQSTGSEKPVSVSVPASGFCHQCGAPLKEDALFCHHCGTKRKGAE
jgi:hypothetical protein